MLQTLLRDRFQMKMHRETRDLPVYGLVIGKNGVKLKESTSEPAGGGAAPQSQSLSASGKYDFSMEFSPEDFRAMMIRAVIASGAELSPEALKLVDASSGDTLLSAVEKLGLRLESTKAPVETLVIDDALKTPTEN